MATENSHDLLGMLQGLVTTRSNECLEAAIMAVFGWFAHFISTLNRYPNRIELMGGILLSSFLGWVISQFLVGMHMDPHMAASLGGFLGSGGGRTYEILMKKELKPFQGDD